MRVSRVKIVLTAESEGKARIIHSSLLPDNKPLPQGLEVRSEQVGRNVIFYIECSRPLSSLLATVDDVLKMAQLAEGVVGSMGGRC